MSLASYGQSDESVNSFLEEHSKEKKFFLYQSLLRIVNIDHNKDFDKLIKNVEYIKINTFKTPDSTEVVPWKELQSAIKKDGYEELISFAQKGMKIKLTMKGDESQSSFLIFIVSEGTSMLAEMEGYLDLRYLGALATANFDRLNEITGSKNLFNFD